MKKLLIPIATLIVGFTIGYLTCKYNSNIPNTDCCKNLTSIASVNMFENIDSMRARTMVENYKSRSMPIPNRTGSSVPQENSRCVWFNIDSLKKFVDMTKCERGDGVRIYFATYPDNERHVDSQGHSYANYNTVVLVSTEAFPNPDETHHHQDFYTNSNSKKSAFFAEPQNKGELYPPGQDVGARLLYDEKK